MIKIVIYNIANFLLILLMILLLDINGKKGNTYKEDTEYSTAAGVLISSTSTQVISYIIN